MSEIIGSYYALSPGDQYEVEARLAGFAPDALALLDSWAAGGKGRSYSVVQQRASRIVALLSRYKSESPASTLDLHNLCRSTGIEWVPVESRGAAFVPAARPE